MSMSTRSTSSQYSWRQFTEREREKRENRERETPEKKVNHRDEDYNEVETPRRSTRNKDKVKANTNVQQQKKTSNKTNAKQEAAAASVTVVQKAVTFETVQPARTRAQKRLADAAEAMVLLQDTPSPAAPEKAERRTAYWVKRDDKRRQSARLLKIQSQE